LELYMVQPINTILYESTSRDIGILYESTNWNTGILYGPAN
jgi:hypothetical protein